MNVEMEDVDDVKAEQFRLIEETMETDPQGAIKKFREFLKGRKKDQPLDMYQERAIFRLMKLYAQINDARALVSLLKELRESFDTLSKSKRENIVKNIVDKLALIPNSDDEQMAICEEYIEFFKAEKRDYLRQRFQTRLAAIYSKKGQYPKALNLLSSLQTELKKLDDKLLLVEVYLIESKTHHALKNLAKAKSSLTAARSNANAIYVGVTLQAEIDMQSGILNTEEHDYRIGFSYFLEAHEGFNSKEDYANALTCLKYMLLTKIMNGKGDDVPGILNAKNSVKYVEDKTIQALSKVAEAYKDRSLEKFSMVLEQNKEQIETDPLLKTHLTELKSDLLEQNLCRIIEPYSRVEVERIAQLIKLPEEDVMSKLSQMILDKKFRGILDQGSGELIVYEDQMSETTYEDSLQTLQSMGHVVSNLVRRARQLQAQ